MDYWTTLIAHWVKRNLDELGYSEPDDYSVVQLSEVSTRQFVYLHYQEIDGVCNIIIPNEGLLYKFLTDKNYRIANCVFQVLPQITDFKVDFLKVNNYGVVTQTKDYVVFKNIKFEAIDNLETCSLTHQNNEDLEKFKQPFPLDILQRVLKMFGL